MTHVKQVHAASEALRTRGDPFSTAVASWLDTAARDMALDTARWPRSRPGDLDTFLESLYRHPLAVARAATAEAERIAALQRRNAFAAGAAI